MSESTKETLTGRTSDRTVPTNNDLIPSGELNERLASAFHSSDEVMAPLAAPKRPTIQQILTLVPTEGHELVQKAYDFAERFHGHQTRKSGEPYIIHPLAVAYYLARLNMDPPSIAAGLLHDVIEDTHITYDELRLRFPDPVADIVRGVTKISKMDFRTTREAQIENLRIMILAMASDIRVVIVKLCDRLHNMKTLKHMDPEKRIEKAEETLDIYAPLANRLGMATMRSEMEDLSMRWLYPDAYQKLSKSIAKQRKERERTVRESIAFLRNNVLPNHPNLIIKGRPKHFYSIYRKMKDQGLTFEQIFDLNAIRIICAEESQCYEILGLIHSMWPPIPGRFKDYIGMPKKNMYQSIHTTVLGLNGNITEIQIRTNTMHQVAELGIAAHWTYKEGLEVQNDERLAWLRHLTEWITDPNEPEGLMEALKKDVFADCVLCFTPAGDVIELPSKATPIDFAYAIHTKVGERCVGAKINGRMTNLRAQLHNSDVVEIVTAPNGHPSRDWLEYVVTGRARSKIKHWLKARNVDEWVDMGRKSLARILQDRNIRVTNAELEQELTTLLSAYKMQTVTDLLVEIGFGSISAHAAIARMNPEWVQTPKKKKRETEQETEKERLSKKSGPISIDGASDMENRIANCCMPIPGDPIIAYTTRGRGVTVHHADCPNVQRLKRDPEEQDRLLVADWNDEKIRTYNVTIYIEAEDRSGLLNGVSGVITAANIFIRGSFSRSDDTKNKAVLQFELALHNTSELENVLKKIRLEGGVYKAERRRRGIS
jgi:GTP diphosphokinase / guanosine-3',5'-bis(diphosphate) 3'-diphosphatase